MLSISTLLFPGLLTMALAQPVTAVRVGDSAQMHTVLEGRIRDTTGEGVPHARVTVTSAEVPEDRQTVFTDPTGYFAVVRPAQGRLILMAEAAGFAAVTREVVVEAGAPVRVDLTLPVAGVTEAVQVSAGRLVGSPDGLLRIPGAVDVLDGATLEASRVFSTSEALRKLPGLAVRDEEGFGLRPNIGIRGTNPTRSSRVLLLEDGLPLTYAPYGDNATYYHPPIERFASVEVLKGSAQIAYGPMTVGGVINYITPPPPPRASGSAALTVGSRDYLNGHASYGTTRGRTGLLLDYMRKQGDGARAHTTSQLDDVNAKVSVALGPAQSVTVRGNYYGEDSTVTYSGLREDEFRMAPRSNAFANDALRMHRGGGSATHVWAPRTGVALSTSAYASLFDRRWWRQSSHSGQRPNDASDPRCGGMDHLLTTCGNEGRLRTYSSWGVASRLDVTQRHRALETDTTLGVRIHGERQERTQENGAFPTAREGIRVEDNQRRNLAYSAFVQQRLPLGRWTLTPGLRLEHVLYARTNRLNGASGTTTVTAVIPGIGLSHAPGTRFIWFAGLHRGFAPPRTEDVISNVTGGSVDLEPELSWNAEVGTRTELRPGLKVDATAFRMDYRNQVIPASLAGGIGATLTNGGATRHHGAEVSVRLDSAPWFRTARNVSLRTALTWLPVARFEGARFSSVSGFQTVSVRGHRLPYAPELSTTVALGYASGERIDVLVEAVHVTGQFGDDLNTVTPTPDGQRGLIPGSTLWNAAANYRLPRLGATVFATVKNIRDTLVIVDRSRGILPGMPRLVQVGVKVRF